MNDEKPSSDVPEALPITAGFNPQVLTVGSAVVAILLVALWMLSNKKKASTKGTALLLVGPPDAGKTAILSQLAFGQNMPTQTSMQTNLSNITLSLKTSFRGIDVPGHPRLRGQFVEHLADAKVIAFVVDASTVSRNAPAVAEHLHHVLHALTSLPPSQQQPTLLILAHKSDLLKPTTASTHTSPHALAMNRVKTVLERELEKRRASQNGGVNIEGLGEEGERSDMGGLDCGEKEGSTFKFDEWGGGDIIFMGTSVMSGSSEKSGLENSLELLWEWLEINM